MTYPANVPGCDEVEPPPIRGFEVGWTVYGASRGYDDPNFPWLTAEKATAMSDALAATLPADVEVRFDAPERMLRFQPIFHPTSDELPDGVDAADLGGDSGARAAIAKAGSTGTLRAAVVRGTGHRPCAWPATSTNAARSRTAPSSTSWTPGPGTGAYAR